MSEKKKVSFSPPPPGDPRAPPYSFYLERLFDAVKQLATWRVITMAKKPPEGGFSIQNDAQWIRRPAMLPSISDDRP